ncbi:cell division protein ZapB [candidate division GN15 bacterium]|nr:cell division protein ZapB [candidate division GN15 bacterium]
MSDKLARIEDRVDKLLALVERLKDDNRRLREQNRGLKADMAELQREFDSLRLSQNDQAGAVRAKLSSVLNRIEELESMGL